MIGSGLPSIPGRTGRHASEFDGNPTANSDARPEVGTVRRPSADVGTQGDLGKAGNPHWRSTLLRVRSSGVLWIIGGTLVAAASAFLSSILTARGMPVDERGRYVQVIAVSQLCGLISSLGLTYPILSLSRGSAASATDYLRQQASTLMGSAALGALVSFSWGYALGHGLPAEDRMAIAALCAVLAILNVSLVSLQIPGKARQDFQMIGTSTVITGAVALIGIVLLSFTSMLTAITSLLALVVASLIAFLYVIVRSKHPDVALPGDNEQRIGKRRLLGLGVRNLVVVAPSVVLVTADVLIVGWTVGFAGASVWAVAKTVSSPVLLIDGIAQNYIPSRLAALGGKQAASLVRLGTRVIGVGGLAVGMVCVVLAGLLLVPVFGEQYAEARFPAALLTATAICTGLRVTPATELNLRFDYRFLYFVNYGIGLFALALGMLAAVKFGLIGLATAFLFVRAAEAILLTARVSRSHGR